MFLPNLSTSILALSFFIIIKIWMLSGWWVLHNFFHFIYSEKNKMKQIPVCQHNISTSKAWHEAKAVVAALTS